jgi:hypothetical protein
LLKLIFLINLATPLPNSIPFIILISRWDGLHDELYIYPDARTVAILESQFTDTRAITFLNLPVDSVTMLKELVLSLDLKRLPIRYGRDAGDMPIQLRVRKGHEERRFMIGPEASLPEELKLLIKIALRLGTIAKGMPLYEVLEIPELSLFSDSALIEPRAVIGVYEQIGDEDWLITDNPSEPRVRVDSLPKIASGSRLIILGQFQRTQDGYRVTPKEVELLED